MHSLLVPLTEPDPAAEHAPLAGRDLKRVAGTAVMIQLLTLDWFRAKNEQPGSGLDACQEE